MSLPSWPPVSSQSAVIYPRFLFLFISWKSQLYFCLAIGCWAFYYTVHSNTPSHGAQIPQHETLKVYSWQQILCDAFLELGLFCLFEGSSMPDTKSLSPPSPSLSSCFLSVSIWSLQVRHATLRWYLIYLDSWDFPPFHTLIAPSVIPGVSLVKPLCDVCAPASCPHTQSVHLCLVVGILEVGRQSCLYLSPSLPLPQCSSLNGDGTLAETPLQFLCLCIYACAGVHVCPTAQYSSLNGDGNSWKQEDRVAYILSSLLKNVTLYFIQFHC